VTCEWCSLTFAVSAQAKKRRAVGEEKSGTTETTCTHSYPWSRVVVTRERRYCWPASLQGHHLPSTEYHGKQERTLMTARRFTLHIFKIKTTGRIQGTVGQPD